MLNDIKFEQVLVIDIETVPVVAEFIDLDSDMQQLWVHKHTVLKIEHQLPEDSFAERGGIYAEFGKIVCISVGLFHPIDDQLEFRVKSFASDDEKQLLSDFAQMLNKHYSEAARFAFSGHNIKEFDVPYLCRRMLVNGLKLPGMLDISGKKPWEINHIDTMQLWKFGDYKNYTPLKMLTALFHIPTPKDDIDGSEVAAVYWKLKDLDRIVQYCQKDVLAVAQLLLKLKGQPMLQNDQVVFVDDH